MVFPPLWDETEDPETPRDTAELSMKMGARVKHKKKVPTKRQGQDKGHHSNQGFFWGGHFFTNLIELYYQNHLQAKEKQSSKD